MTHTGIRASTASQAATWMTPQNDSSPVLDLEVAGPYALLAVADSIKCARGLDRERSQARRVR